MNISAAEIKKQYQRAKANGWLSVFEDIAQGHGTTVSHFLAIGSRETNLKNIKGDYRGGKYHGFGVMQVDVGTDPEFTKTWSTANAVPGILRGGDIYQEKVDQIKRGQGKTLSVRGKKFTGKPVESDDIRRIATAAYNSGLWPYYHFSKGNHVDTSTTGQDYSRDVYDRAIEFAKLLKDDGHEDALIREVDLQGKYAREEHKKLVKTDPPVEPREVFEPPKPEDPKPVEEKKEEPSAPAATAPPTPQPEGITVQKVVQSLGSKVLAGGTVVMGALTAVGGALLGVLKNPYAFAIVIVGCAALGVYAWNKSKDRQLKLQLDLNEKAASKDLHTVKVSGPPPPNT